MQKQSVELGTDLVKQLLTLATGALALTVTLAKDLAGPLVGILSWLMPLVLFVSWFLLVGSIFAEVWALGGAVRTAYGAVQDGRKLQMEKNVRDPLFWQGWLFFGGIFGMLFVGILAFTSRKPATEGGHDLLLWTPAISGPEPQSPRFKLLGETRPFVKGSHVDWEITTELVRGRPTAEELANRKVSATRLAAVISSRAGRIGSR